MTVLCALALLLEAALHAMAAHVNTTGRFNRWTGLMLAPVVRFYSAWDRAWSRRGNKERGSRKLGVFGGEGVDEVHLGDEADQGAAVIDDEADLITRENRQEAASVLVAVNGVDAAEHDLCDGA